MWPTVIRSQRLVLAGPAGVARLDAAGGALQDRIDDDPGPRRQVLAVVEKLGDHLVAGHERQRHESREVEAGATREGAEVGAADARQPGLEAGPAGLVDDGLVERDQPQRGHRS